MKIVFIPNLPYTYRDHNRFGVKYFLDEGYDVEVIDIHKILLPGYKEKVDIDYFTFENYIEIEKENELLFRLSKLTDNDFIFFYFGGKCSIKLLNKMKKTTSAKFITYVGGSIPELSIKCNFIKYIELFVKKNLKDLFNRSTFSTDYFISGSPKDENIFPYFITKNTSLIKSNSRDYDLCLDLKAYQNDKEYCVFLDTDAIDASDYIITGNKLNVNTDTYFNKLIEFFHWIQNKYNIEVIISAHPKSRVLKSINNLKGIKVVHGKSAELVKGSKFVINEGTTAISYAIFFDKPIIFISCSEIEFFEHTCNFSRELNKKVINIENFSKDELDLELENKLKYEYYKYNYLTYHDKKINTYALIERDIMRGHERR